MSPISLKDKSELRIGTPEAMRARKGTVLDVIVELHTDGLAAWMLRLPPGSSAAWPAECGGTGRHRMVAAGTLIHEGKPLLYESLAFACAGEGGPDATAGADGAEVLIMQYPKPDQA